MIFEHNTKHSFPCLSYSLKVIC